MADATPGGGRHGRECAERIRLRTLIRAGDPERADVRLLHRIAEEIKAHCGLNALKAHRLAHGWTVGEGIRCFQAMCKERRLPARGLTARSWLGWEGGGRPDDDYQDRLCRLFQTSAVRLGFASDYTPQDMPSPGGDDDPVILEEAGISSGENQGSGPAGIDSVTEIVRRSRRLGQSNVDEAKLTYLERTAEVNIHVLLAGFAAG